MRILIVRHGDPDYVHDCLTEKGKREATLLAEKLKKEKIDYFYSSPLGRAKETCLYVARAMGKEKEVVTESWLREFDREKSVVLPNGEEKLLLWDLLPEFWTPQESMYDRTDWVKTPCFGYGNLEAEYAEVVKQFDACLAKHGYVREGNAYRVEKPNRDTLIFFCHFGLEMVLLSRLFNISPVLLTHHFVALTSSLTTVYSEERRKGIATFRCCGFSDTSHLYVGNEPPSYSARFCETFDSEDRHD